MLNVQWTQRDTMSNDGIHQWTTLQRRWAMTIEWMNGKIIKTKTKMKKKKTVKTHYRRRHNGTRIFRYYSIEQSIWSACTTSDGVSGAMREYYYYILCNLQCDDGNEIDGGCGTCRQSNILHEEMANKRQPHEHHICCQIDEWMFDVWDINRI